MAQQLVKVTIAYCAECGYEPQTLALVNKLMLEFRHELSEIEIIPWIDGSFDVTVGGELIHSMYREGGFPEHQVIIDAVKRHQIAAAEA
jgi:selenoprotein W-related protein